MEVELAHQRVDAAPLVGRQLLARRASADRHRRTDRRAGTSARGCGPGSPCTWFFSRVRCLTRWVRRITSRRSIRVRSSATQVPGKKSAANSWARIRASTLSVFTFASAIARVLRGFDTTTRAHQRAQHRGDRVRVRRRLQRDLVVGLERRRPRPQVLGPHPDPALVAAQAVLDDGDLRERAMHVHADRSHHCCSSHVGWIEELAGRKTTETDSRSQRSRASRRGGQVLTRARSSRYRAACPS